MIKHLTLDTTATIIGYLILCALGIFLVALVFYVIWFTIVGTYRVMSTKTTIRFMNKCECRATAQGTQAAYDYLKGQGCKDTQTLGEVRQMLERFRKRHKV